MLRPAQKADKPKPPMAEEDDEPDTSLRQPLKY